MRKIEQILESFLWNCRFIVLFAVLASIVSSGILFIIATADVGKVVVKTISWYSGETDRSALDTLLVKPESAEGYDEFHSDVVSHVISAVDDYLLATVLLIFSLGLYELFISKIDQAEQDSHHRSQILLIKTLDDLKDRLAKVVLMILIVTFFKNVIHTSFTDPLNILYLGGGILLVALALYFTSRSGHAPHPE